MKTFKSILAISLSVLLMASCNSKQAKMKKELTDFIKQHDSVLIPLYKQTNLASWDAAISGKPEDFKKAEDLNLKMMALYSNKESLKKLEEIKISGMITDTLLNRELDVLYRSFLMAKADTGKLNAMVRMGTVIEQKYGNFRTEVKGKKMSDNDVEEVLRSSKDVKYQKEVWEAQKKIGTIVADDIKKLVKLRNEVARELGFNNYHEMSLTLSDQDPKEVSKLFDELDSLTAVAFVQVKGDIDNYFVKYYSLKSKDELMPWNYQNRFFQEAPKIYKIDLDKYYKNKNIEELTSKFYAGIGLPINDMLAKSDLYEKPGKNQHAFCNDIDYKGDTRVLCNIRSNAYWMNTMLHEFGHAVYEKFIDPALPFVLHQPAHTFTTEAIAMMFGRQSSNSQWIKDMVKISDKEKSIISEAGIKSLRLEQLVFSRWVQVVYRFEKRMYENPDQDLNKLWWTLVEKYQMIKMPDGRNQPDWASKIHIATVPCYYHNYLLGEMLASQVHYYICDQILKTKDYKTADYFENALVGIYLKNKIFSPGARYYWNEMIERATNEKLTAKYYAKQFVE